MHHFSKDSAKVPEKDLYQNALMRLAALLSLMFSHSRNPQVNGFVQF